MLIAGAGGFAIQLFDVLQQLFPEERFVFYDDTEKAPEKFLGKYSVVHSITEAEKQFQSDKRFALGIGKPELRKLFFKKFISAGGEAQKIISPFTVIGKEQVGIGDGAVVLSGSIIESTVTIGKGCLINLHSTITHGTTIGNYCEISPGVCISGNVSIGNETFIGTGAIILPKIKIGNHVVIGAGAVVTKNIPDGAVAFGNPAVVKREL